jgi:hypothetical protein
MMLPRKNSNRITIDERRYRYIVSERDRDAADDVALVITVQDETANGACLHVEGLETRRVPLEQSKFYMGRTVIPCVEPRHIALLISLAIEHGWVPDAPGSPFQLQVQNPDVFLPDPAA